MTRCLVFFINLLAFTTGYAQTAEKDIPALLKPGKHLASIISISPPARSARQNELLTKVMKATQQNMKWFTDSLAQVTADIQSYHAKFGLTKEEFEEYLAMGAEKPAMNSTLTAPDTLELIYKDQLVRFRGRSRLSPFDSLHIDLKRNIAVFRGQEIPYKKFNKETDSNNPFKSALSGHEYSFELDGGLDMQNPTDMKNYSSSRYTVMIGKLDSNGKTALLLLVLQMEKGRMIKNIMLPCILD